MSTPPQTARSSVKPVLVRSTVSTPRPFAAARAVAPGTNSTVVLAFTRFAQTVPLGNPDHIMLGPMKALHGAEKHTRAEWLKVMQTLKSRPVPRKR